MGKRRATNLEDREAGDVRRGTLASDAHELPMDQVLAVEGEGQEAEDGTPYQQLEGRIRDQQGALHACAVLDGRPHILVRQLPAPHAPCDSLILQHALS